jgi:hypothetical protein
MSTLSLAGAFLSVRMRASAPPRTPSRGPGGRRRVNSPPHLRPLAIMRRAAPFEGVAFSGQNKTEFLPLKRYFTASTIVTVELGNPAQRRLEPPNPPCGGALAANAPGPIVDRGHSHGDDEPTACEDASKAARKKGCSYQQDRNRHHRVTAAVMSVLNHVEVVLIPVERLRDDRSMAGFANSWRHE